MFRIANGKFTGNEKLHKLATECLTKTIKYSLEDYFFMGYDKENPDTLYKKVDVDEVIYLLPEKLLNEMIASGIDMHLFLQKKVAEFMNILNSEEEITPDVFIEYLLYRMIITSDDMFYYIPDEIEAYKEQLMPLLDEYASDYVDGCVICYESDNGEIIYEDALGKEIAKEEYENTLKEEKEELINQTITNLTDLPNMSLEDDSLVFWDWDFSFFDDWGFENALKQMHSGPISIMAGYGEEYINNIFKSSNMEVPEFLR